MREDCITLKTIDNMERKALANLKQFLWYSVLCSFFYQFLGKASFVRWSKFAAILAQKTFSLSNFLCSMNCNVVAIVKSFFWTQRDSHVVLWHTMPKEHPVRGVCHVVNNFLFRIKILKFGTVHWYLLLAMGVILYFMSIIYGYYKYNVWQFVFY